MQIKDAAENLHNHEAFHSLLNKILHYAGQMTVDELTICLLYLTKLTVDMKTDVMSTILKLILQIMRNG